MAILLLLQSISAAQDNSARQPELRAGATLAFGRNQPFHTYPEGSLRDSRAIETDSGCAGKVGTRDSLEAQEIGRSYAEQVEATSKIITDRAIVDYMNRVGQNLDATSGTRVQLTLKVIASGKVNAFSLPGGFIFVDSGLILAADNEAELAGVISHELGHLGACHSAQELAREELSTVSSMPVIFRLVVRQLTRNTVHLKPTRSFESEADSLALEYMYQAGYDPAALPSLLEKVTTIEKDNPMNESHALDSHSLMTDRLKRARQKIKTLRLRPAQEYKVDSSDFQEIKERLSELEKAQKLDNNNKEAPHDAALNNGADLRITADAGSSGGADQH